MKYHGEYEADSAFVSGGSVKWKLTGNGEYITGTKGGRRYFIKRNMHVRQPTRGEPKAVYEKYKGEADAVMRKQTALRKRMCGLSCDGDRIAVEEENFFDAEKMFVTVTSCIRDALPDAYDYRRLSQKQFTELARKAAVALQKLHARGVIHGDLKEKNILVVKKGEDYLPYLIDFDSSYLADDIPDWDCIGGTDGYQSPEVLLYGSAEGAAARETVTPATDIFTLGLVMHRWRTGAFPCHDMEKGSVGAAVYLGGEVTLNGKLNVKIGDTCGATLVSLINWMLAKEPTARPSAEQVAAVLSDAAAVPEEYLSGDDEKPFDTELWRVHNAVAALYPAAALKDKGVKSFKRVNDGCGSAGLKYRATLADGAEKTLSVEEIISDGYAEAVEAQTEEPWEEHMIRLASPGEISAKGYAKIARTQLAFRKRYTVTTNTGREFDKGYEWLIREGLAQPVTEEVAADTPWSEHGKEYVPERLLKLGIQSISRVEVAGEHRYKIVYRAADGGEQRVTDKVSANNLKIMGVIK